MNGHKGRSNRPADMPDVRTMPCVDGPHRIVTATVDGWPTSLCEVCGEAWWVLEQRMREAL